MALLGFSSQLVHAQQGDLTSVSQKIQRLSESMSRAQAQLEESRRELDELRQEFIALQESQHAGEPAAASPSVGAAPSSLDAEASDKSLDELRERQEMQQAQIATHEQTKVETGSKYPLKITGMLLLNAFVNTSQVDTPATPTVAYPGAGSTGASVRQTLLAFEARGPHLLGARSSADLSVDFNGSTQPSDSATPYSGYYSANAALLRLRTVHASLDWQHGRAYFALDRPIISPDAPTSLTAVAEPALAWSGNLWTWNPQIGGTGDLQLGGSHYLRLQTALIDVGDAPLSTAAGATGSSAPPPSAGEQSRWPGIEARIAILGADRENGSHLGFGGYFSPHLSPFRERFDAWAGTLDARLLLPMGLQFTGSFYRGADLGGLGGGGYKDYGYRLYSNGSGYSFRPLDDVGGWAQLKETLGPRVEVNGALGLDNVFARELRRYAVTAGPLYENLARNRTFTGNVIYSPSSYLLFSLEYRRLQSSPVTGASAGANIIGLAAGYKF